MAMPQAKNAQATSAPVSSTQAMAKYSMPGKPVEPNGLAAGVRVLNVGQDTGRTNKLGQPILSKSLVIRPPKNSETGLSGDAAMAMVKQVGEAIKPSIMGRVAAFSNQAAVIVRRYSETPGKRNKLSLTLEQISVESTIAKLAREYNMTEDEVRKRLNIPEPSTAVAV